ncbi:MAG TPA: VanZ family protein [Acidimicrobiales bacterium]|nr:VanZ family protein [Acidimicrobiales bacterium]
MFDKLPIVDPSPALVALDLAILAVFCSLAVVWVALVRAHTHNRAAVVLHGLFAAYLVVLACVVFLPLHGVRAAAASFSGTDPLARAWYWGLQLHNPVANGHIQWQRLANVVMTIPFGFGFGLLAPRLGVRRIFAACMAWAVSLELVQLGISLALGIVYRTFDINDIVDNVFGAWIGLACFVTCALVVHSSGYGAGAPDTTLRGFVADSVDRYFAAHEARRHADSRASDGESVESRRAADDRQQTGRSS